MANMKVKKGDTVLILAGKENGKTGEVLESFPAENKVTVKGLNIVVKHNKPRSAQDKGGIVKKEGKIDASDVMVVCPSCNKATRVKVGTNSKGEKARVCKKCGATLDSGVKPAKKPAKTETAQAAKKDKSTEKPAKTSAKKEVETKVTQKHDTKKVASTAKSVKSVKKSPSTAKKIGGK